MRSLSLAASLLLFALTSLGCSSEGGDGSGEQGGGTSGTGQGGSTNGGTSSGGSSGATSGGSAGSGSPTGGTNATGGSSPGGSGGNTNGGSGGSGVTKTGLCGQNMLATVTDDSFEGTLDFFTVSEEVADDFRFDEYICQIRFDVTRVGEAPNAAGCVDLDGAVCEWTHLVELGNPVIVVNENGVCARNQLMQDQAWMDSMNGTRIQYGFVDMYEGHASAVMKYNEQRMTWETHENATWDMGTKVFTFNSRAFCTYVE